VQYEPLLCGVIDMKIKLTKLTDNIQEGYETTREVEEKYFEEPQLGRRFNVGTFSTSGVQEIIDKNTFRTYSSIYRWERVD
jgi:hypothetical protein